MSSRPEQLIEVQKEAHALFILKNTDYGDSFATYGPIGVIVRMQDKISRLMNIQKNGMTLVDSESMRDTLIDLHNYSAMAVMLLDENASEDMSCIRARVLDVTKSKFTSNIPEKPKRVIEILQDEKKFKSELNTKV